MFKPFKLENFSKTDWSNYREADKTLLKNLAKNGGVKRALLKQKRP
jgi:hypothetical protein